MMLTPHRFENFYNSGVIGILDLVVVVGKEAGAMINIMHPNLYRVPRYYKFDI